jgi:nucleoside-diphosphate-sugar epimerase
MRMNLEPNFAGQKVLITGGCGFIGTFLASTLTEYGARVTVFDASLRSEHPAVTYIRGNVCDFESLSGAMRGQHHVFHLAAILGVERIVDIPLEVLRTNLEGTSNALQAAVNAGVRRFVFTSSSEVYGEPRRVPVSEADPTAPVSIYGVSKLAAEAYCRSYHQNHGLPCTILRLFNVYGPGQTERFVMPMFISRVLQQLPPVIYGSGEQSRCYTFVSDAVDGIVRAGASPRAVGEVYNIGNDEEVTIYDLARYVIGMAGNDLQPVFRPFGEGIRVERREILRRQPDIRKAQRDLGFSIKTRWQEGVREYFAWCMEELRRTAGGLEEKPRLPESRES